MKQQSTGKEIEKTKKYIERKLQMHNTMTQLYTKEWVQFENF